MPPLVKYENDKGEVRLNTPFADAIKAMAAKGFYLQGEAKPKKAAKKKAAKKSKGVK
tara:strand:+ start:110 stop:280 length:171 start_codon:yes stop_codon:yes gene_type:complete